MGSDELAAQNEEGIFKRSIPKQYFQVRRSIAKTGSNLIAVFNDITRTKELEKTAKKMRAMYFSSVAHELRTPLNSIIPIVQMILEFYREKLDPNLEKYMKIIKNSSLHLQNLIEDALDMCRIENGNFSISLSTFNVRDSIKEIADILDFLIT
jgi:signal transduction histidine kinase